MANKLEYWAELQRKLKSLKEEEMNLRRELCVGIIADSPLENGRVTVKGQVGDLSYQASQVLGYTVDQATLSTIWGSLSPEEREAITYKPSLGLAKYRKLGEDSLLHEAVTARLAAPTLKVEVVYND